MFAFDTYDIPGLAGMACILIAFAMNSRSRGGPTLTTILLNILGSSLLLVSLWFKPNPAAAVLQVCWIAIALESTRRLGKRT